MAIGTCVLFLLNKRGYGYGNYGEYENEYACGGCGACANCMNAPQATDVPWINNSGLYNSCAFVVDMLNAAGIPARLVQVSGQTEVAEKIRNCGPTDVVFEAFFIDPPTLNALTKEFPTVRFFVRNHSETAFLAYDSNAMGWIKGYLANPAMHLSANTVRSVADLTRVAQSYNPHWDAATLSNRVRLLPNYHPVMAPLERIPSAFGTLNVACLGAIRPLKNHLQQAIAASEVARVLGKKLLFHVNGTRIEHQASGVIKNLKSFFAGSPNSELVEHDWLTRPDFLRMIRRMDIGMQVSISETFNLVTADFVQENVPVVVSPEIAWTDSRIQADPANGNDIVAKMQIALRADSIVEANRAGLIAYDVSSQKSWLSTFGDGAVSFTDAPKTFFARPALATHTTHK